MGIKNNTVVIGGVADVAIQDQTSEPIDLYLCSSYLTTAPTAPTLLEGRTITVASVAGVVAGDCIDILENGHAFQAVVQSIATLTVTFNCPTDRIFTTGATVMFGKWNMNVNGSVTHQIYKVRPPAGVQWDINRVIIGMADDTAMDDGKFGGIASLTNGLVFRTKDGTYKNLFVVSDNGGFRERSFDVLYADKAPAGTYGFGCRKSFNGQDKHGVALRLDGNTGDELQVIIQDDLTGLIKLAVVAQGHQVV